MIRSMYIRAVLVALVAGLGLVVAPMPSNAHVGEVQEMTKAEAGAYYNKHACNSNDAWDRFIRVLWKGKQKVTRAQVRRRLPQFKRESRRYGRAEKTFVVKLRNPPAKWPANVIRPVKKLANKDATYAGIRLRQGRVSNAAQWLRLNARANHVQFGSASDKIRARLDLPPPGQAC